MTTGNKIFVVVAGALAAINLIDFVFYGQQIRNLAGAVGFALMAFGRYKNMSLPMVAGAVLALGAIVVKYVA